MGPVAYVAPCERPAVPQVLHCCVNGSSTHTQQSHYVLSLADLSCSDYDPFLPLGNVRSSEPAQSPCATDLGNLLTVAEGKSWPSPAPAASRVPSLPPERASRRSVCKLCLQNGAAPKFSAVQLPLVWDV